MIASRHQPHYLTDALGARERAALIYQHEARGADKQITGAIDARGQDERGQTTMTTARPGSCCPRAACIPVTSASTSLASEGLVCGHVQARGCLAEDPFVGLR